MNVHLACGGTGGHIFPGLATAEVLRERGHEVTLWLTGENLERTAAAGWTGPVRVAPALGFPSGLSWKALPSSAAMVAAVRRCRRAMRGPDRPDVVLGMGSFASAGPGIAAALLRVPLVVHEANVIPGRAVRLLARRASSVAAAFEETRYYLRRRRLTVTGMPLRRALAEGAAAQMSSTAPGGAVLVVGGSRGAQALNRMATDAVVRAHRDGVRFPVIHLSGFVDERSVRAAYDAAGVEAEVHAFHHDMAALYARTALAICRAGASTCAELTAFAVPALLVPYPRATQNHQEANARAMERIGAAHVVLEASLEADWLREYLVGSLRAPDRLRRMRAAARARARTGGAEALADLVEQTGRANA